MALHEIVSLESSFFSYGIGDSQKARSHSSKTDYSLCWGHGCCDGSVSPINDGDGSMSSINDGEGGFGASTGGKSFGRISGRIYCRIKDSELSSWVGLEFPHMPQIWAPQMWF